MYSRRVHNPPICHEKCIGPTEGKDFFFLFFFKVSSLEVLCCECTSNVCQTASQICLRDLGVPDEHPEQA